MSFSRDYATGPSESPERPEQDNAERVTTTDACPDCKGSGFDPDLGTDSRPEVTCRTCDGEGAVPVADASAPIIPAAVLKVFAELDERRVVWTRLIPHAVVAQEICDKFAAALPGIHLSCCSIGYQAWIEAPVKSYADIIAIRREIARHGYAFLGTTPYPSENREAHSYANIMLHARFPYDGPAACRYVQTGTKVVPTYELKCDGEKAP